MLNPPSEVVLMKSPARFSLKCGMNAFVVRIVPNMLVLTMRRICSSVSPSSAPARPYPALLNTRSVPPDPTTCFATLSIAPGSVTSSAISLRPEMSFSSFSFLGSRMEAMTLHPFDANSFAVALPKPEELPVMKIVLPRTRICARS